MSETARDLGTEAPRASRARRWARPLFALCALTLLVLALAAPAAMAYPEPPSNPAVNPNIEIRVSGAGSTQSSSGLAFTGTDIAGMVIIAGVLVVSGVVLIRATRRRVRPVIS